MLRISSWRLAVLLTAAAAVAQANDQNRYEVKFSRDLPYRGGIVAIDHQFGGVTVSTERGSKVEVRATIRSSDPEFGQQIRIIAEESGKGVSVKTVYPQRRIRREGTSSFSIEYHIKIPSNAPLQVKNRFGSISVRDVAAAQLNNSHGSISVRDSRGPLEATNAFGSIDVSESGGAILNNQNGSIQARDVRGDLEVANRFGSVSIRTVTGGVTIRNTNGSVEAHEISGDLSLENGFASVAVSDIKGAVRITNNNGRVVLREVGKGAVIANSFGGVVASTIAGSLTVSGQNSSVEASDVRGNSSVTAAYGTVKLTNVRGGVTVRASFAPVFLKEVGGPVDVQNQYGSISLMDLNGRGCQPINLRSSHSSIKLRLPASAGYRVTARTSNGRISSTIPIKTRMASDETLTGTIGNGSCALDLVNTFGSISIEGD